MKTAEAYASCDEISECNEAIAQDERPARGMVL